MHFFSIGIIILSSNQHYYYNNVCLRAVKGELRYGGGCIVNATGVVVYDPKAEFIHKVHGKELPK